MWLVPWRSGEDVRSPGSGVIAVNHHMWVLGTKLQSSARASSAHNCWAISPAPLSVSVSLSICLSICLSYWLDHSGDRSWFAAYALAFYWEQREMPDGSLHTFWKWFLGYSQSSTMKHIWMLASVEIKASSLIISLLCVRASQNYLKIPMWLANSIWINIWFVSLK